jgi:hypothetical protein
MISPKLQLHTVLNGAGVVNMALIIILLIGYAIKLDAQHVEVIGSIKIVDGSQGAGKVLTSNSVGLASWQKQDQGLSIGQNYEGGIIFYLDGTRLHGLMAKATDEPGTYRWATDYLDTKAFADSPHGGKLNDAMIMFMHPYDGTAPAAQVCELLSSDGYDDWYLPSKYELQLMFQNLGMYGLGGFTSDIYWSSTEVNYEIAWVHSFDFGDIHHRHKSDFYSVRAIRAF